VCLRFVEYVETILNFGEDSYRYGGQLTKFNPLFLELEVRLTTKYPIFRDLQIGPR
jgi:hypothetical protein